MKIFKPKTEKIQKDFKFLYDSRDLDRHRVKSSFSSAMLYMNRPVYPLKMITIGHLESTKTTTFNYRKLKKESTESYYTYAATTFLPVPFKLFQ